MIGPWRDIGWHNGFLSIRKVGVRRDNLNQLVLSGFDDDLAASIRRVAEREKTSFDQAALQLLRKGAELDDRANGSGKIGSSLDEFFGTWTKEEAAEFDAAVAELRVIDESMWR